MDVDNIVQTEVKPKAKPFTMALGGDRFVSLTEWNDTKRVDIRRWLYGKQPTKDGASLLLNEWKILCNHTDEIENQMLRAKDEHVNWQWPLGRGFHLSVSTPNLVIRKFCTSRGYQHMRYVGIDLNRNEWKRLREAMPLIEEREPELRQLIPLYRTDF